jgi:RNA polymerase sigma-70 factor (ECF subfamily)
VLSFTPSRSPAKHALRVEGLGAAGATLLVRMDPRAALTRAWRDESARITAYLARLVRDVAVAEELAQDAMVAALEEWPRTGIPDRPGAWLMTTAKNRALNWLRRATLATRAGDALGHAAIAGAGTADSAAAALAEQLDDDIGDDVLRLVFTACHPTLSTEARVALTLRMIGGLTTDEIARAFLATEPTIAQRIVRAKRALADASVPFEVPRGAELGPRLASVLEVVYLVFNEGYSASAGDDLMRPALVDEALRLGRLLASLAPAEPEVHGLVALMSFHASRSDARIDAAGDPVLLTDQDRSRWNAGLIADGLAALARADALADARGPYHLQAAIVACHARAASVDTTDWKLIASLYATLAAAAPSPIVELNRAMAVSRADGPAAGLVLLDKLRREPALARYHLLPAARADLLVQLGRLREARAELERAAALATNTRQRDRLLARAAACGD